MHVSEGKRFPKRQNEDLVRKEKIPSTVVGGSSPKAVVGPKHKSHHQDGKKLGGGGSFEGDIKAVETHKSVSLRMRDMKRKQPEQNATYGGENMMKRRRSKNKDPIGRVYTDKLDMLMEKYRSRFSQQNSRQTDGDSIRKWISN